MADKIDPLDLFKSGGHMSGATVNVGGRAIREVPHVEPTSLSRRTGMTPRAREEAVPLGTSGTRQVSRVGRAGVLLPPDSGLKR